MEAEAGAFILKGCPISAPCPNSAIKKKFVALLPIRCPLATESRTNKALSSIHNVKDGTRYPATLIVAADKDDRVHPMHAYKMAARLQEASASSNPILLRVETKAEQGSAPAIPRLVEMYADIWGFVFQQLGMR